MFDDFTAVAEELVHLGYTSNRKLAITGASNGGLLIGAAITRRPDLFRAAVSGVPILIKLMDSAVASARVFDSSRDMTAVGLDSLRALQIIADLCGRARADEETALRIMKAVKELHGGGDEKRRVVIEIVGPDAATETSPQS